ncbi:MAG: hypothetical protein ACRC0G_07180 [Fusobacteriaceae bacterium]
MEKEYEVMIQERHSHINKVIQDNPPLQNLLDLEDFGGFIEMTHFIDTVRPYENRIASDEEATLLDSILKSHGCSVVDTANVFERTMAVKKNAEIIVKALDSVKPEIIDTMIRTERLNCAIQFIETNRNETPDKASSNANKFSTLVRNLVGGV